MTSPPLVAVTGTTETVRGLPRVRVNAAYTAALESAGMLPVVVPPCEDERTATAIAEAVDGVLLTGGTDVDPERYGAVRHAATDPPHHRRDRTELAIVAAARVRRTPVLAICRGLQLVNVALGGTLVQDIDAAGAGRIVHAPGGPRNARTHSVQVEPGSRLERALGASVLTVNSSHHQALARPGAGLAVTARAPDGVIEGAEGTADDWWLLAVQWHPEELVATPEPWDRALFAAFRAAIEQRRGGRGAAAGVPLSAGA